ncbi:MAG: ribulose-phosphate 3-epimerase [Patescibacteria group bacterium]|nr:ribulose-phosphate 3-epimerase [Patescibacteria group bacterium]
MPVICPTITAKNSDEYTKQMSEVASYIERIHIDLADGVFAPNKLLPIEDIWWPVGVIADIHVMYQAVAPFLDDLIQHKPNLIIMHAEAAGNFSELHTKLDAHNIRIGIALLADTPVEVIAPILHKLDHVLIFSGDLGYFGGHAKMSQLSKVRQIKKINPNIEIGWDGGINEDNVRKLVLGGVDVLNCGGAIHKAPDPHRAYDTLKMLATKKI